MSAASETSGTRDPANKLRARPGGADAPSAPDPRVRLCLSTMLELTAPEGRGPKNVKFVLTALKSRDQRERSDGAHGSSDRAPTVREGTCVIATSH